jgi:hypothetical protein
LIYLVVAGVFLFEFLRFWGFYTQFYPGLHSREWQYGYKQMVEFVSGNRIGYDAVFVTRELGRPAMYYWFYTKTDPRLVQEWEAKSAQDQGEFLQFENIYFGGLPGDMSAQKQIDDKLLVVELFPNGAPASGSAILVTQFLDGKTGFVIYEK